MADVRIGDEVVEVYAKAAPRAQELMDELARLRDVEAKRSEPTPPAPIQEPDPDPVDLLWSEVQLERAGISGAGVARVVAAGGALLKRLADERLKLVIVKEGEEIWVLPAGSPVDQGNAVVRLPLKHVRYTR